MILVLDGTICVMNPPDVETVEKTDANRDPKSKIIYRRKMSNPENEFLHRVFSTKDTRGDDGSAST